MKNTGVLFLAVFLLLPFAATATAQRQGGTGAAKSIVPGLGQIPQAHRHHRRHHHRAHMQ